MSTKNSMGVLLLVEVRPKRDAAPEEIAAYHDVVAAEFAAAGAAINRDPFFGFEVVSVRQAVAS